MRMLVTQVTKVDRYVQVPMITAQDMRPSWAIKDVDKIETTGAIANSASWQQALYTFAEKFDRLTYRVTGAVGNGTLQTTDGTTASYNGSKSLTTINATGTTVNWADATGSRARLFLKAFKLYVPPEPVVVVPEPEPEPGPPPLLQGEAFDAAPLLTKVSDAAKEPDRAQASWKWNGIVESASQADNPSVFHNEAWQNGSFLYWWLNETHPAGEAERYMAAFNSYESWLAGTPDENHKQQGWGWSGYESNFLGFSGWYIGGYLKDGRHPNIQYTYFLNT